MENQTTILTGVTPSGTPHLGNYIGAIRPAIERTNQAENPSFLFVADNHSLIKLWSADKRRQFTHEVAATWLALGLNPQKTAFYRQSDVPEIFELCWILNTVTSKGLLNRAHAYKAAVQANEEAGNNDLDAGVTMGLFNYPVLMAADILLFHATHVPVGKDQIQHVEIARDIANRFNHIYKTNTLTPPEALVQQQAETIPGLDGRKMSKSYNNTILLFDSEKKLRKQIMKIVTNSLPPEAPKDETSCPIFQLYRQFATDSEIQDLQNQYHQGIGWGQAKQILFEKINAHLAAAREYYQTLMNNPEEIEHYLQQGAAKARTVAKDTLYHVKKVTGII